MIVLMSFFFLTYFTEIMISVLHRHMYDEIKQVVIPKHEDENYTKKW